MRQYFTLMCAGLVLIALSACATMTPYQPAGDGKYGYTTKKLEDNKYRVTFQGNSHTDKATVRNYLLYRAAQLTLSEGGDYFVVANRNVETDNQRTTSYVGGPFLFGPGFIGGGTAVSSNMEEYEASGVIVIHKGDKPANSASAYDARQVERNLRVDVEGDDNK